MPKAVSNTPPLLYLHRIDALGWLPRLFSEIWVPAAVADELREGRRLGYDVPDLPVLDWLQIVAHKHIPPKWLNMELGRGELSAMAIALENENQIVLLDDGLARRTAQAASLQVWGTLKILLEAKTQGITQTIEPWVNRLADAGLWFSDDLRKRILALAEESSG